MLRPLLSPGREPRQRSLLSAVRPRSSRQWLQYRRPLPAVVINRSPLSPTVSLRKKAIATGNERSNAAPVTPAPARALRPLSLRLYARLLSNSRYFLLKLARLGWPRRQLKRRPRRSREQAWACLTCPRACCTTYFGRSSEEAPAIEAEAWAAAALAAPRRLAAARRLRAALPATLSTLPSHARPCFRQWNQRSSCGSSNAAGWAGGASPTVGAPACLFGGEWPAHAASSATSTAASPAV